MGIDHLAFSYVLSKIIELGFNEKFIRTWEYYFDYCAAGFKSCALGNYQVDIITLALNCLPISICGRFIEPNSSTQTEKFRDHALMRCMIQITVSSHSHDELIQ